MPPENTLYSGKDVIQVAEALEVSVRSTSQAEERAGVRAWQQWIGDAWAEAPGTVYR